MQNVTIDILFRARCPRQGAGAHERRVIGLKKNVMHIGLFCVCVCLCKLSKASAALCHSQAA